MEEEWSSEDPAAAAAGLVAAVGFAAAGCQTGGLAKDPTWEAEWREAGG